MTPSELKTNILKHDHESHYFDRKTMQFFGDTMRNYGVRRAEIGGVPVWGVVPQRAGQTRHAKFGVFPVNGFSTGF